MVPPSITQDPSTAEAAQIVLDVPVKKTMIPLNVTHTAIVTQETLHKLLSPGTPYLPDVAPSKASTKLRHMLWTLIYYFAESYKSTFGFMHGPPLHDALTIAYVSNPEMFKCKRYRVDVELSGAHTAGETVVDIWNYRSCDDSWGRDGKNCMVAESLDVSITKAQFCAPVTSPDTCPKVESFFKLFLDCVARCDEVSPLNQP